MCWRWAFNKNSKIYFQLSLIISLFLSGIVTIIISTVSSIMCGEGKELMNDCSINNAKISCMNPKSGQCEDVSNKVLMLGFIGSLQIIAALILLIYYNFRNYKNEDLVNSYLHF